MSSLRIRVATKDDAAQLLAIYRPYVENTAVTFEYEAPTVEEFAHRIENTTAKYPYLVAEFGGEIIGYTYAGPFRVRPAYAWSVETSIYVRRDMKQRGVGRQLYERLEILLAKQNVTNLYACIASPEAGDPYANRDSLEFHAHMGYRMVGEFKKCAYKFGRWYTVAMMEKTVSAHGTPQQDVIPFPELNER